MTASGRSPNPGLSDSGIAGRERSRGVDQRLVLLVPGRVRVPAGPHSVAVANATVSTMDPYFAATLISDDLLCTLLGLSLRRRRRACPLCARRHDLPTTGLGVRDDVTSDGLSHGTSLSQFLTPGYGEQPLRRAGDVLGAETTVLGQSGNLASLLARSSSIARRS